MKISSTAIDPAISNQEFIAQHARAGCIGLCSSAGLFTRVVQSAERKVTEQHEPGIWSHAFIFQGMRPDGHLWVVESDLEIHRRNIRLGVQENRADKFYDHVEYPNMAILDFDLSPEQIRGLLHAGLDMVSSRIRYSIRELFGTLAALHIPKLRTDENRLGSDKSIYCSALVIHLFSKIGIELVPGIHPKRTTPGDITRTPVPHSAHVLKRKQPSRRFRQRGE